LSRSKRKTPKTGNTTCHSEKQDKADSHRKTRALEAQAMLQPEDEATPPLHHREATNPWNMGKDGKHRFDPAKHPELMRK
jgi:hypothetical protein